MKKEKKEVLRIQNILENDRMHTCDSFNELVIGDLACVLNEYFDFNAAPKLKIEKFGDRYNVEIFILASRIKNFDSLPR
jgi:hypothetical protein